MFKKNKYILKSFESFRNFIDSDGNNDLIPMDYITKLVQYNVKLPANSIIIESYEVVISSDLITPNMLNNLLTILLLTYDNVKTNNLIANIYIDVLMTLLISSCKNDNIDINSLKLFTNIVISKFIDRLKISYAFPLVHKICPIDCPFIAIVKLLNRKNKHLNYVPFLQQKLRSIDDNKILNNKLNIYYNNAMKLNDIPVMNIFNDKLLNGLLNINNMMLYGGGKNNRVDWKSGDGKKGSSSTYTIAELKNDVILEIATELIKNPNLDTILSNGSLASVIFESHRNIIDKHIATFYYSQLKIPYYNLGADSKFDGMASSVIGEIIDKVKELRSVGQGAIASPSVGQGAIANLSPSAGQGSVGPTTFRVLSWNLYWKSLAFKSDASKGSLEYECNKGSSPANSTDRTCFKNIIAHLRTLNLNSFSLIAFQEGTTDQAQLAVFDSLIPNHRRIPPHGGITQLLTYYDHTKYYMKTYYNGKIDVGRPFDIVELQGSGQHFYFINLHNGHSIDTNGLSSKISPHITNNSIPIIMAGDWNDAGQNYWNNFKINGRPLMADSRPPITCCTTRWRSPHTKIGDYIISTNGATNALTGPIDPLTSDHLPVIGTVILPPLQSVQSAGPSAAAASSVVALPTELNIGYDFDGVIHRNVYYRDGQGHPNEKDSGNNQCFDSIINRIKEGHQFGYKQYIITNRTSRYLTQVRQQLNKCLGSHLSSQIFPNSNIIFVSGDKSDTIRGLKLNVFYDDSPNKIQEIISNVSTFESNFELFQTFPLENNVKSVYQQKTKLVLPAATLEDPNKLFGDKSDIEIKGILTNMFKKNVENILKTKAEIQRDLTSANISIQQFNKMVEKNHPLGFRDNAQYTEFLVDICNIFGECVLHVTGSSTTFYSDNPSKKGKYFDDNSDIDIGVYIKDHTLINGKCIDSTVAGIYSQCNVFTTLSIKHNILKFHYKWGKNDWIDKAGNEQIALNSGQITPVEIQLLKNPNTLLRRNIGIIVHKKNMDQLTLQEKNERFIHKCNMNPGEKDPFQSSKSSGAATTPIVLIPEHQNVYELQKVWHQKIINDYDRVQPLGVKKDHWIWYYFPTTTPGGGDTAPNKAILRDDPIELEKFLRFLYQHNGIKLWHDVLSTIIKYIKQSSGPKGTNWVPTVMAADVGRIIYFLELWFKQPFLKNPEHKQFRELLEELARLNDIDSIKRIIGSDAVNFPNIAAFYKNLPVSSSLKDPLKIPSVSDDSDSSDDSDNPPSSSSAFLTVPSTGFKHENMLKVYSNGVYFFDIIDVNDSLFTKLVNIFSDAGTIDLKILNDKKNVHVIEHGFSKDKDLINSSFFEEDNPKKIMKLKQLNGHLANFSNELYERLKQAIQQKNILNPSLSSAASLSGYSPIVGSSPANPQSSFQSRAANPQSSLQSRAANPPQPIQSSMVPQPSQSSSTALQTSVVLKVKKGFPSLQSVLLVT